MCNSLIVKTHWPVKRLSQDVEHHHLVTWIKTEQTVPNCSELGNLTEGHICIQFAWKPNWENISPAAVWRLCHTCPSTFSLSSSDRHGHARQQQQQEKKQQRNGEADRTCSQSHDRPLRIITLVKHATAGWGVPCYEYVFPLCKCAQQIPEGSKSKWLIWLASVPSGTVRSGYSCFMALSREKLTLDVS